MGAEFTYAVARIRSKELSLFSKQGLEQLLACKNYEECLQLLKDKGWGQSEGETAEQLLAGERDKTWSLIRELVDDMSVFDVFLYSTDFHNLKAAIKQVYISQKVPNIFMTGGTIDPAVLLNAAKNHEFGSLPDNMRACAEEAYEVLFHTGDSQLCDVIIDKAALQAICRKGEESKNDLLSGYAELKCAAANINIAIRGCRTGKGIEFLQRAFAECDSLNAKRLLDATLSGEEAIYEYLETTVYSDAIDAIKEAPSAFERWCDNRMMELIRPQKYNPFTISPLAAYILARENEIKSVRILLSGKLNDLPEESIRERLREMYV